MLIFKSILFFAFAWLIIVYTISVHSAIKYGEESPKSSQLMLMGVGYAGVLSMAVFEFLKIISTYQ